MDYSKYGISESYMPTVYHNRIVIDKKMSSTINTNLLESAYIQGTVGSVGNLSVGGASVGPTTKTPVQTLVTVDYNIVFNVPSYADFVNLVKDDDFGNSFIVRSILCWRDPDKDINGPALIQSNFPAEYSDKLQNLAGNINNVKVEDFNLLKIFNSVANDSLNLSNFDNFTRYQRKFPDGQTFFQVPYTVKFSIPKDKLPYIYLASFVLVKNFQIDLNLNFGEFQVDDSEITSVSALEAYNLGTKVINPGPLTVDTLINNSKPQTKGALYTISQNQSTYQGQPLPAGTDAQIVQQADLTREEKFNDLKGTPWLGAIHEHQGRFMAGAVHTDEPQPYLDLNVVQNKKLIDLRPIKDVKEQKINLTPTLTKIKSTKINYFADNSKENFLEKLTVVSNPLLSTNKDSNIDGIFVINYTNFLRKHSIFSNLVEKPAVLYEVNLTQAIQETLKIRILRHDVKSKVSKLIFDSSRAEEGVFYEKPSLETQQFSGNLNNINIPLGYLNVVSIAKNNLDYVEKNSILEFYNFTDLDAKKQSNAEYRYEIEIEMKDPIFEYLSNGVASLDRAIRGNGETLGLQQILNSLETKKGKSTIASSNKQFSYVQDTLNQNTVNAISNSTIIDAITSYDLINGTNSLTTDDNTGEIKLTLLEELYNSSILFSLGSMNGGLIKAFKEITNNILNLEDAGNISVDLFRLVISTLSSIRDNIKDSVNAISNVDITTQSFGYRAPTVSAVNGNIGKRIIREKIMSSDKITKQEYGFDYLKLFPVSDNKGLKQMPSAAIKQVIDTVYLPKFFDTTQSDEYSLILNTYLANFGYSTLTLTKEGVVLPEGLHTQKDSENWRSLLQFLLLFISKNASKLTKNSTFTYTQNEASDFKFDVNKNILGLSIVNDNNLDLFKSLDRGQKQLATKGLSVQDEIKTNQSIFVEYSEEIQTDQKDSQSAITIDNLKRNDISDYFLNYINNAVENGNENKDKVLDGLQNLALVEIETNDVKEYTIPVISLLDYEVSNSDILGQPEPGVTYRDYYENRVWSAESKRLFLDKFADFFFDFINSVKIEYLSGFGSHSYQGILEQNQISILDFNNVDASSYEWTQLTNSILNNLEIGQAILCKMVDFVPAAFRDTNVPLIQKLKFYKKYYNYFLIIKGQKDLQIKTFGDTI